MTTPNRRARSRAREKATTLSALVRGLLNSLGNAEAEALAREERRLRGLIERFSGGDRLDRAALHDRAR